MTRLIRIELLKLRTTPAAWVALTLTSVLTVVSVFSTVLLAGRPGTAPLGSVENVSQVLAVAVVSSTVMLVLGIMISAAEDRYRTSLSTFLAEPRRARVLLAKMITAAGIGTVAGAATFGLALAVAVPLYADRGVHHLPVDVGALWLGTTMMTACYGLLGVALGALTRNTVAAIIGALAWVGVVELGVLQPLLPAFAKWLPTGAGRALTSAGPGQPHLLPPGVAALVLVGWAVLIAVTASRITLRRELR
jgi:ABC-2 type transport system permease protein